VVKPCYLRVEPGHCKPNGYRITLKPIDFEEHTRVRAPYTVGSDPTAARFRGIELVELRLVPEAWTRVHGPELFPRLSVVNGEAPSAQPCNEALTAQMVYQPTRRYLNPCC